MSDQLPPVSWGMPVPFGPDPRHNLEIDLRALFAKLKPESIKVSAIFNGFSSNQERRIVLGVEVRTPDSFQTHIVKLGIKEEIEPDYKGWKACVLSQNFASRIFVQLHYEPLDNGRAAAVYEDGYLLYGKDQKAHPLLEVTEWATLDSKPEPASVERVIYQVFTELERWFYVTSNDTNLKEAGDFYHKRLRNALEGWDLLEQGSDAERARTRKRADLRRNLIWILCAHEDYNCTSEPNYLDPVDYVRAALREATFPSTLVGRSHGDLHGLNMLVGVQRGHAEFPTVFDYGEMDEHNVLAWDFAKLETELKRVILPKLIFRVPAARSALLVFADGHPWKPESREENVERTLFFHAFENRLAELTEKIDTKDVAQEATPLSPKLATPHESINRLLLILWRIRKEAALCLGFRRNRQDAWINELYFALAVYGLCNGKPAWQYEPPEACCALVSAGVAAARLERRTRRLSRQIAADKPPAEKVASYRVLLAHSHRLWKADALDNALTLLENAYQQFPLSVPLLQEYALVLTDQAERTQQPEHRIKALELVKPLRDLCRQFRDHETLSRLGKIFRSHGDACWAAFPQPHKDFLLAKATDWQYYFQAEECYREAHEFNDHIYPGINAATLAWVVGNQQESQKIAGAVKEKCEKLKIGRLDDEETIWLFATEGEAWLLLGQSTQAAELYRQTLDRIYPHRHKMAKSMYDQVCRLWWVLGAQVQPVVAAFRAWEARHQTPLAPGPFGNCK